MFDNDLIIVEVPDATHTVSAGNVHLAGTGLTAGYTAVLELDGLAFAQLSTPSLVMTVEKAGVGEVYAELEVSVDGGTTYRKICRVTMPTGGKGQISQHFGGQHDAMFRRTAANVQCKVYCGVSSDIAMDFDRVMVAITDGEPSISGKLPADTILP